MKKSIAYYNNGMINKALPSTGRLPRFYDESGEGWYHCYNRIACNKDEYPLEFKGAKEALQRFILFYSKAYECELATYIVMGNHFHILLRFPEYKQLKKEELEERVHLFYPNTFEQSDHWSDEKWKQFNRRLFDVSSYMRNVQQGFATWYNKAFKHRGRVWADRFKSTLIYGDESMVECMQYIDLNAVRAGLVEKPEEYQYGAMFRREINRHKDFVLLKKVLNEKSEKGAYICYKSQVYFRGAVKTKEYQKEIPEKVLQEQLDNDFKPKGVLRKKLRFFTDGLIIGSKEKVLDWLDECRSNQIYQRRKNPIEIENSLFFCLREQRSHFEAQIE